MVTTGRNDYGRDDSLYTVITADRKDAASILAQCVTASHWSDDLHVLPASPLLEGAERELIGTPGAPYRLAEPLSRIANHYAAIIIDTRPSFSLLTEMSLLAATDAIVPVEPRYLETVGLQSVVNKIIDIREGWRHPHLRVTGIVVTKMDRRMRGHIEMVESLKAHSILGKLLCGIIPSNEAVAYAHQTHQSVFEYAPHSAASKAYAQLARFLVKQMFVAERA